MRGCGGGGGWDGVGVGGGQSAEMETGVRGGEKG